MKRPLLVCILACLCGLAGAQTPLGADFTYQGQLRQSGVPLNGSADFQFKLFTALTGGTQIGSTQPVNNLAVSGGVFTAVLNFGAAAFGGDARFLEIAVRSPAGGGTFTTLNPRQPLTAAPYALYALSGPGSGGPWATSGNNVFNTNTGNVGLGTPTPQSLLDVNGSISWGGAVTNFARSGEDTGGVFVEQKGATPARSNIRLQSSRSGNATDYAQFFIDPGNGFSFMTLGTGNGNVGVGTAFPAAKLDVRGDIRLGPSGQFRAPACEENLRIIRGRVDSAGNAAVGSGFTSRRTGLGFFEVTFTTPFAGTPVVTATAHGASDTDPNSYAVAIRGGPATNFVTFVVELAAGGSVDRSIDFIAIGPR